MDKICPKCKGNGTIFDEYCTGEMKEFKCETCDGQGTILVYETPEQYKQRTGEEWPDDAFVWYIWGKYPLDWNYAKYRFVNVSTQIIELKIIIANESGKPPSDFRPED